MKKTILRLKPVFHETIWGGEKLNTIFHYPIPSDRTGECWAISGHQHGDCAIENAEFSGETLSSLWIKRPDLFGYVSYEHFPLLIKIIDAKEDLSIQVHPDDMYAKAHEDGAAGKAEFWYILDCAPDAGIVIGHHADSKEEMMEMIQQKRWKELIREIPIQKGDFFQINPGCLHAIKGGTLILETQQSSDITYRFYDYDRLQNGEPRKLHMKQSLDVTKIPFEQDVLIPHTWNQEDAVITKLIACSYYTISRVQLNGKANLGWNEPFVNVSILDGAGFFDGMPVKKGDHFIITANYGEMLLEGELEFIYSHI